MIEVVVGVVVEMEMIEIDKITEIIVLILEEIGQHRSTEERAWKNRPDACTPICTMVETTAYPTSNAAVSSNDGALAPAAELEAQRSTKSPDNSPSGHDGVNQEEELSSRKSRSGVASRWQLTMSFSTSGSVHTSVAMQKYPCEKE